MARYKSIDTSPRFIALCGDSAPHFTYIASFVPGLGEEIAKVFARVLYLCDRQGLIGREMFAIDGVKLPSNASKAKSGSLWGVFGARHDIKWAALAN